MQPPDLKQRHTAVDPKLSCIVQAPAGSGKTELLSLRVLALLAIVDRPEDVVSITFTRKAAREMHARVIGHLRTVEDPELREQTRNLARRALHRAKMKHWRILENPDRLRIQTIDSFVRQLLSQAPVQSGLGGTPNLVEHAEDLYAEATEEVLCLAGEAEDQAGTALQAILEILHNDRRRLEQLLRSMLAKREQWLRHLGASLRTSEAVVERIEAGLRAVVQPLLLRFPLDFGVSLLARLQPLVQEICARAPEYAASKGLRPWQGTDCWREEQCAVLASGLRALLLNAQGEFYKSPYRFPQQLPATRKSLRALLQELQGHPNLARLLHETSLLPALNIAQADREYLRNLFVTLSHAYMALQEVFRRRRQLDFNEITLRACRALGAEDDPSELLLRKDTQVQHLLIDEFQDVSQSQYDLFGLLTSGWQEGDGRTLFLVGDPMQSIYRFRDAEVSLFLKTWGDGFHGLPMQPIRLTANFRSDPSIVSWLNNSMTPILPTAEDRTLGAIPYSAAVATVPKTRPGEAVRIWPLAANRQQEAVLTREIIAEHRSQYPHDRIAILVRNRAALAWILPELERFGLRYLAQDVDPLAAKQSVRDLENLTLALLHPGDRLRWLACLRAPWTALTLHEMHDLVGGNPVLTVPEAMQEEWRQKNWPAATRARLAHFNKTLAAAMARRPCTPLAAGVEDIWLALSGPAFVATDPELQDARTFFEILEVLGEPDENFEEHLQVALQRHFAAPDTSGADASLQIMTIHKAKGLEFDCVILPGLDLSAAMDREELLRWQEFVPVGEQQPHILVAPLSAERNENSLYAYLQRIARQKELLERQRLLYVASTRARHAVHFLAAREKWGKKPRSGTLLDLLWPVAKHAFAPEGLDQEQEDGDSNAQDTALDRFAFLMPDDDWRPQSPSYAIPLLSLSTEQEEESPAGGEQEAQPENTARGRYLGSDPMPAMIGDLVHKYLAIIHDQGLQHWPEKRIRGLQAAMRAALHHAGAPDHRIDAGVTRAQDSLLKILANPRGRELLDRRQHQESQAEWALVDADGYQLRQHVLDLMLVTQDGERLIVDWKTAQPRSGESREDFLARQQGYYAAQLNRYRSLYPNDEPPAKTELFLPFTPGES